MLIWKIIREICGTIRNVFVLFRKYSSKMLWLYFVMLICTGCISFVQPILSRRIVDSIQGGLLLISSMLFLAQNILTSLIKICSSFSSEILVQNIKSRLQINLIHSILNSSNKGDKKGKLIASFYEDTSVVANLGKQIFSFIFNIVVSVVGAIGLLIYQPVLFFIGIVVAVVICILSYKINIDISNYAMKKYEYNAQYMNTLNDIVFAYEELKFQNTYDRIQNLVVKQQKEIKKNDLQCDAKIEFPGRILDLVVGIIPAISYIVGSILSSKDSNSLSYIVMETSYFMNFVGKSFFLAYIVVLVTPLQQALKRIEGNHESDCEVDVIRAVPFKFGKIIKMECCDISFSYINSRKVLNQINFSFQKCGFIGVFGKSGSGKSTLFKILMKELETYQGEVYINSISLKDISMMEWRNFVGYMHQGGLLISGTILDNIKLFCAQPKYDYIDYVAQKLNLIQELGDDYLNYFIGEGSVGLSVGQKDRIRLLCILSKMPNMLILDEPAANVDLINTREMYELLKEISKTIFVVCSAHDSLLREYIDYAIELD